MFVRCNRFSETKGYRFSVLCIILNSYTGNLCFRDSFHLKSCLSLTARGKFLVGASTAWPVAQQG